MGSASHTPVSRRLDTQRPQLLRPTPIRMTRSIMPLAVDKNVGVKTQECWRAYVTLGLELGVRIDRIRVTVRWGSPPYSEREDVSRHFFNSNNFATSAALVEVCATGCRSSWLIDWLIAEGRLQGGWSAWRRRWTRGHAGRTPVTRLSCGRRCSRWLTTKTCWTRWLARRPTHRPQRASCRPHSSADLLRPRSVHSGCKEQPPDCDYCKSPLTVEHTLTSCFAIKNRERKTKRRTDDDD